MDDAALNEAEIADLRCLAGMIIPPSAKYGVPGADDDAIFANIIASLGRDADAVRAALARLRGLAGGPLAELDIACRAGLAAVLREQHRTDLATLTRIVFLCYYRDERIMLSLGLDPRPPFPRGHAIEQGDWSLLDPVRARNPFWRPISSGAG